MNIIGLIVGAGTFLIIGLFHRWSSKVKYYFGTRCWWAFLLIGIAARRPRCASPTRCSPRCSASSRSPAFGASRSCLSSVSVWRKAGSPSAGQAEEFQRGLLLRGEERHACHHPATITKTNNQSIMEDSHIKERSTSRRANACCQAPQSREPQSRRP